MQAGASYGQEVTRILFVFDASNSMNARWQTQRKIDVARKLLKQSIDELQDKENLQLGLRVYGHQSSISTGEQDCNDTKLEVPLSYRNGKYIKKKIDEVQCKGTTPIARSLEKAANDFTDCDDCRNIIILITDGIEACDEDPCAVSRALRAKNIILKPFVIGIGIDEDMIASLQCIGNFYDASSEDNFEHVLNIVITQALNSTTAQINLLNANDLPLETNVPITIYDNRNGEILYDFVHTLNHKGNPDTLFLDPIYTYNVVAHTLPEVRKNEITVTPGNHNIIALNTPQGDLIVKMNGRVNDTKGIKTLVRQKGKMETVFAQNMNHQMRYLVGSYDLEILTLPRTYISDVRINQSNTTSVEIPAPGLLLVKSVLAGYGAIMKEENNQLTFVVSLDPNIGNQSFNLQPGKYRLVFRSKNSKESLFSIEKKFEITSGRSTSVQL
jgi:Ca-activated chloride channel family protein